MEKTIELLEGELTRCERAEKAYLENLEPSKERHAKMETLEDRIKAIRQKPDVARVLDVMDSNR